MKWTAIFHYGSGYACPEGTDVEHFASLKDVGDTLWRRADFDPYYPCVDREAAEAHVFSGKLDDVTDLYPDRIVRIGPRGGIRIERA